MKGILALLVATLFICQGTSISMVHHENKKGDRLAHHHKRLSHVAMSLQDSDLRLATGVRLQRSSNTSGIANIEGIMSTEGLLNTGAITSSTPDLKEAKARVRDADYAI